MFNPCSPCCTVAGNIGAAALAQDIYSIECGNYYNGVVSGIPYAVFWRDSNYHVVANAANAVNSGLYFSGLKYSVLPYINLCRVVFDGPSYIINGILSTPFDFQGLVCSLGYDMGFNISSDWPSIASYVQNGGRIWLSSIGTGFFPGGLVTSFDASLPGLLSAIGSSMSITHDTIGGGLGSPWTNGSPISGHPLTDSVSLVRYNYSSRVIGGTPIVHAQTGETIVAVEKVGNGWVVLSGDSMIVTLCSSTLSGDGGNVNNRRLIYNFYNQDTLL
jgi:hypothetical protein